MADPMVNPRAPRRRRGSGHADTRFRRRRRRKQAGAASEARGLASTVSKQLRLKFGPLPDAVSERLAHAGVAELDGIAERLLFAETLDAALGAG